MENVSLASEEYHKQSKVKQLSDNISQKTLSSTIRIPPMSDLALKRWCDARDAYLGQEHPYVQPIQKKIKTKNNEETISVFTLEPDIQHLSPSKQQTQIIHDHFDDKCVGTEINSPTLFKTDIEQMDQGIQVDLPPPQFELHHEYDTSMVDGEKKQENFSLKQKPIEYSDKAIETDPVLNIESVNNQSRSFNDLMIDKKDDNDDDDMKTILSSTESNTSVSEQLQRLKFRFKRLSKERRLLSCILILYIIIMCALLVVIFYLLWAFQGRSLILYRGVIKTNTAIINGITQYGESCNVDNDCKRPFICYKKSSSSSSGTCRCPLKYDLVNNQCIGDLNALCTKDTDCQRYMLCSGMEDRTRRCHCQPMYDYDIERKQCRGDYDASCQSNIDCRANLICNTTHSPSICVCQYHYRYYPFEHKCRGDPGAICEQTTAECIDNAECRDGVCECAFQFISDRNKICVDPCPKIAPNPVRIRYPGNCRRFIDCQQRSKSECPEMTIFNFRTQLCDYPKNVLDC
ncbi:unnamed protein product [Adineta steineri]|uniref:Chitin-binding type-2 domain-containing protein n=1 Tax=Adineta steineri TaxID=433720 RepID=A0A813R8F7_9BILA|nr:unnamed protein product [Adineta steineri]CAF0908580.1 unnamed protein product [Adineta steineri]CAF1474866.1 unnamed protein product [Adineta steineri]